MKLQIEQIKKLLISMSQVGLRLPIEQHGKQLMLVDIKMLLHLDIIIGERFHPLRT